MRIIYNISKPQIKKVEKINDKEYGIGGQIYFQPYPNSPCNKVYYVQFGGEDYSRADDLLGYSNTKLVEYDECSKIASKYLIEFTNSWDTRLFLSSDKKYFIIVMEEYNYDSNKFYIEVRVRENLDKIILQNEFSIG